MWSLFVSFVVVVEILLFQFCIDEWTARIAEPKKMSQDTIFVASLWSNALRHVLLVLLHKCIQFLGTILFLLLKNILNELTSFNLIVWVVSTPRPKTKRRQTFKRFTLQVRFIYYEQWYVNRKSGNASVQTLTLRRIVYMLVTDLELVFVQGEGVVAQEETQG